MSWAFPVLAVERVVDGDTVDLRVDVGFRLYAVQRFRLADVDTPEIFGVAQDSDEYRAGIRAREAARRWLVRRPLTVVSYGEQSFGRWVADVVDGQGESLSGYLVAEGYDTA